jgi:hypothetical protein
LFCSITRLLGFASFGFSRRFLGIRFASTIHRNPTFVDFIDIPTSLNLVALIYTNATF